MIGSRQLSRFVAEAEAGGAKIVLVGDHEQLQAINAGAPFRALVEQIGAAELSEVRRQKVDWQRQASVAFATHKTADALQAYDAHGAIHYSAGHDDARAAVVRDYLADRAAHPNDSRVAMAHRRDDVRAINQEIRQQLQQAGQLAAGPWGGERTFQTIDGSRNFSAGDRVVFLENSADLGVKNGMLGTVTALDDGQMLVAVDGKSKPVQIVVKDYKAIDHGYATTIHKNQGATVDRSYVLASRSMDRHLTYVAMSRHRESVQLYAGREDFAGRAGRLVDHGAAPYENDPRNRRSYFATLETETGERRTVWGVDLERALTAAGARVGDRLALERTGSQVVTVDGREAERNSWKVAGVDELARRQLYDRLGRDGSKESTLDYTRDFAQRRDLAGLGSAASAASSQPRRQERPMATEQEAAGRRPTRRPDRPNDPSPLERRQLGRSERDRQLAEVDRRIAEAAAQRAAAERHLQVLTAERDALDKKLSGYLRIDESDRVERDLARANLRLAGAAEEFQTADQAHKHAMQARAALEPAAAAKPATPAPAAEKTAANKPTAMQLAAAKRMMELTRQQSAKPSPTAGPNRARDRDKDPGLKR